VSNPRVAARKRRSARDWKRLWRNLRLALWIVFIGGFGVWFIRADVPGQVYQGLLNATAQTGLKVRQITIEGNSRTDAAIIRRLLGGTLGDALPGFDPHRAMLRLSELPWVAKARVERLAPDTIRIVIEERVPMALWQRGHRLYLLDNAGSVIVEKPEGQFDSLILLVGDGAPGAAKELLGLLAQHPALRARVTSAVRVSERRWNLFFDHRIEVRLPEENTQKAWNTLARLASTSDILSGRLERIDLRLSDRIITKAAQSGEKTSP
jgi:cell division protein FtsQ